MPSIALQTFSGTHYEIGLQQGQAVRGPIHKALKQIPDSEDVQLLKPRLLPTFLFLALAKRRANKLLRNDIFKCYPKQAQRMRGMAEGAGIDIPTILLMQLMEFSKPKESSYRLQACTSLGFSPKRTTTAETIIGKNFDYMNEFAPYHLTCQVEPTERYKTLGCTMGPLPGMVDGMNEYGLTVTYNYASTTDKPECFVPLSLALQEMLETCKNVDEAVRFITQAKQGGHSALLLLADAEYNMKTVEVTPNHAATRGTIDGQIINTNHYHTAEMQQYEIPRNTVYFGNVRYAGVRVHESSEQRLKRAQELLKGKTKVDGKRIATVLRDHGDDNRPSMLTICRHGIYASTLRSMILYPNRKRIKVLYGNPCQNEYDEFGFL